MSVRDILKTVIPTLRIVQIALSGLDSNETGLDDVAAQQLLGGINAAQAYIDSFPEATHAAKGYEEIKAYCDNVLNAIDLVLVSDSTKELKLAQVRDLVGSLTDDFRIFPAKHGADGAYLAASKHTASLKLEALEQSREVTKEDIAAKQQADIEQEARERAEHAKVKADADAKAKADADKKTDKK